MSKASKILITGIMASALAGLDWGNCISNTNDPLSGVNLKAEYDLIQHKKSKLPARLRRMVVYRYEKFGKGE